MDQLLEFLQWPALLVTLVAAWLVAARGARRRAWGFGLLVLGNLLWALWGWQVGAPALIVLQAGLFALNLHGILKSEAPEPGPRPTRPSRVPAPYVPRHQRPTGYEGLHS